MHKTASVSVVIGWDGITVATHGDGGPKRQMGSFGFWLEDAAGPGKCHPRSIPDPDRVTCALGGRSRESNPGEERAISSPACNIFVKLRLGYFCSRRICLIYPTLVTPLLVSDSKGDLLKTPGNPFGVP